MKTHLSFSSLLLASSVAFVPFSARHPFAPSLAAASLEEPPLSPLTEWGQPISDIRKMQEEIRKVDLPEFGPEISAQSLGLTTKEEQLRYFQENADEVKEKMQTHGAVVFRGFDLMKEQDGFQEFYNAIGMKVCQDPLQSVSARPTADGKKDSPVYEAVNKESRKNFFIGKLIFVWSLFGVFFSCQLFVVSS